MQKKLLTILLFFCSLAISAVNHFGDGRLTVSPNGRFIQYANGKPFFWLGDTGWLLPERLNRDEAAFYLRRCAQAGYNVVQIQVVNGVPCFNIYGQMALSNGFDCSDADIKGVYGYWNHLDYIIDEAARQGIYIGLVCIWGGLVKAGLMNNSQAQQYGKFLAQRYKDKPNIIWIIGGDIEGSKQTEVWNTLATTIKQYDKNHLMTFHPRGRTCSARWWNNAKWLDFNMFQSGHRRYGQKIDNKPLTIPENTEEDNWQYVDSAWSYKPIRPVLDGEPSYEGIPKGLHDANEPLWTAREIRRYAYWSVFAGACGHTYGHNNIMQFAKPGVPGAYFADGNKKPWYKAMDDPGFNQMQYLKNLMLRLPFFERVPCQNVIVNNGTKYDRLAATRGKDYLLVYNYTGRDMTLQLDSISGQEKRVWWMDAANGKLTFLGKYKSGTRTFRYHRAPGCSTDGVLIAIDSTKDYITD